MIRINLLPVKKAKKAQAGQRQLVIMGAVVVASIGGVLALHFTTDAELEDLKRENATMQTEIDRLKTELGDYEKVKAQRENLLKQRSTIERLQAGRAGPVFLMREMSEILTANKGPTFDRIDYEARLRRDPNFGINSAWDTRRVWIDTFDEDNKRIRVRGSAKSNEDVAEFLKRLQVSVFFSDVNWENTVQASASGVDHVTFNLTATVSY